jgi:hypothetical protein
MIRRKERPGMDPVEQLKGMPLIGETIRIKGTEVLQTPNPGIMKALRKIDPRVRCFPTDKAKARGGHSAYLCGVADLLPAQILTDFPGERRRTMQRGVVVSLRDEFPHFQELDWADSSDGLPVKVRTGELTPMRNIITILRTGSDRGGPLG